MAHFTTWNPSDDELETFGLMTFETETGGSAGGTEDGSYEEDEDDMPPSQG